MLDTKCVAMTNSLPSAFEDREFFAYDEKQELLSSYVSDLFHFISGGISTSSPQSPCLRTV
jgi:hypothetical protein